MAEEKASEKIRGLEPEILQYMSREAYEGALKDIKDREELYSEAAEKCWDFMVIRGIGLISEISSLAEKAYDRCTEKRFPTSKCVETYSKLLEIRDSEIARLVKDLKKCGAKLE
jgi:hypothetical protein